MDWGEVGDVRGRDLLYISEGRLRNMGLFKERAYRYEWPNAERTREFLDAVGKSAYSYCFVSIVGVLGQN